LAQAGVGFLNQDWLANTEWSLLHTIEDALFLGVDGVVLMAFVGIPIELETYRLVSEISAECLRVKMPLMVEALPCPSPRIPDAKSPEAMASAARLGFEHGADLLKSYYTGTPEGFRHVVRNCPAPVLIAGGPKVDTNREVLQQVAGAMEAGAAGVVFGRNIWQSGQTQQMIGALRHVIHDNGSVDEAVRYLKA
jgi:DhnA family fructose-bisphosphate aldolase class Ia